MSSKKDEKPNITFTDRSNQSWPLLESDEDCRSRLDEEFRADYEKLEELCDHFGVERGPLQFFHLSLKLACELYPAPKKKGAKTKWDPANAAILCVEVENLVQPADPAKGVSWACTRLAKEEPWRSFLESKEGAVSGSPADALRRIYYNHKGSGKTEMVRDAYRYHEFMGTAKEWLNGLVQSVKKSNH